MALFQLQLTHYLDLEVGLLESSKVLTSTKQGDALLSIFQGINRRILLRANLFFLGHCRPVAAVLSSNKTRTSISEDSVLIDSAKPLFTRSERVCVPLGMSGIRNPLLSVANGHKQLARKLATREEVVRALELQRLTTWRE